MSDVKEPIDTRTPALEFNIEAEGLSIEARSFGRQTWDRFRRHKLALVAAALLVLIILMFIFGPSFSNYEYDEPNIPDRSQGPSLDHPFGTDPLGRDMFVRVLRGGRISMRIALVVAVVSTTLGTLLGAVAGYFGKAADMVISQLINLFLIMPALIILFVFAIRWGNDINQVSVLLGCLLWVPIARIVRGQMLTLKEQEFVQAARAAGAGPMRIIGRHLLPNVVGPIVVQATLVIGTAIILESTLAFLGLGVTPPDTSLGVLINDGKGFLRDRPSAALIPGGFIVGIVLCINFLGDGLRDAFDPTSRRVRE